MRRGVEALLKKKFVKNVVQDLTSGGHEWMRAKWSAPIRKYWKISEQMMVKYCDLAIVLLALSFSLSCYHLTMGIMWFVTAMIGVAAVILISQLINENRILQYFGRISLIILCIHGPVYRIVVKIVSILLNLGTDAVRENFLLAMVVVVITMAICSTAYEVVVRLAPL